MKRIFTTILCCAFFSLSLFAQQAIQAEIGIAQGTNDPGKSYALTWIASEGLVSGGALRLTYMKALTENSYYFVDGREDMLQIDVTKRWHRNLGKKLDQRVTVFMEVGLSGMVQKSVDFDCIAFCGTGSGTLSFPVEERGLTYNYKDRDHQVSFLPGSTLSTGINVKLTKRFYMGLNYRTNAYYKPENKDVIHYRTTALTAGFRF